MPSQKRSIEAVNGDSDHTEHSQLLHRIRNMWQFANLSQWIYIFGKAAKIDDKIDIEELETECLKPNSTILADIALALLKLVSSHRGLTPEIFDDQARKAFLMRQPDHNPFGDGDDTQNFDAFDVFTKIRVLQQLTQWTMSHPDRLRDKMEEQKDSEQTSWRIEPYGWDSEDRTYFVLDDNRVYRLTEAPPPPPPSRPKKRRKTTGSRRSSARRRSTRVEDTPAEDVEEAHPEPEQVDDGLGGMVWECVAVTLAEVQYFLNGIKKTRDDNERVLRKQLEDHLLPILEKQEESRKRKELQRERDLLNMAKLANAKRSSRIADKAELKRQEDERAEEARIARETAAAERRERQKQAKVEKERDFRMFSREKRLQERDARRKQHEADLARLAQTDEESDPDTARMSERRIQAEIDRKRLALQELEDEEEDWVFDCICGMHGHVDDGSHSIACEKCNVWQHSQCLGVSEEEAEKPEFHFVCSSCQRREKEAKGHPKHTIKIKLNRPGSSGQHEAPTSESHPPQTTNGNPSLVVELPAKHQETTPALLPPRPDLEAPDATERSEAGLSPVKVQSSPSLPVAPRPTNTMTMNTGSFSQDRLGSNPMSGNDSFERPSSPIKGPSKITPSMHNGSSDARSAEDANHPAMTPLPPPNEMKLSFGSEHPLSSPLATPIIHRDGYPDPLQSDVLPSKGGISPTKNIPQTPEHSFTGKTGMTPVIPPVAPLHPSPHQTIMTPPVKHMHSVTSPDSQKPS